MTCKAPRCYKSKTNTCSVPNPWIIFNRLHKGFANKEQKDTAYANFVNQVNEIKKTKDENAYRAALCLRLRGMNPTAVVPKSSSIVSRFVKRLMKERKEIEMECKMTPNLVKFFEMFVPSSIIGSTMNPCQVIAKHMLSQCVPKDQLKYYTFQDNISSGAHGLLLTGTYKKTPVAIKIIPVHVRTPYTLTFTVDGNKKTLKSVVERNIVRETKLQKAMGSILFNGFRVPKIYGNTGIIRSKTNTDRIAVIVMDKVVDAKNMELMPFVEQSKSNAMIPPILQKLHSKGFIHGDLHMWNLMVTDSMPFVIDFGRSLTTKTSALRRKEDIAMLKIMDYIIPLEMVLRGVNNYNYTNVGKMASQYIEAIDKSPARKAINLLLSRTNNELFNIDARYILSPLPSDKRTLDDLQERYNSINNMRWNQYYSRRRVWSQVLDI